MSQKAIHVMIGRAVTDRSFREHLLRSPLEATRDFPLTSHERELIASVRAASLEEFSRMLRDRMAELSDGRPSPSAHRDMSLAQGRR